MEELKTCTVEGCTDPVKAKALCYAHYMRQYRRSRDLTGQRFGRLTIINREGRTHYSARCDCGKVTRPRADNLRSGATRSCGTRCALGDEPGYAGMHSRVLAARGPAKLYQCVDCHRPAAQWSYDHLDDAERIGDPGVYGAGMAYSLLVEHYLPRCVSCHKQFDLDHVNPRGVQDSLFPVA